jgi:SAM-dependent methyltransferase
MPPDTGTGTGPGAVTRDGCAVEMYALLPAFGEPALIDAAIPAGASVLDLGCGTGRLATPLARLGHPVTAVDESPDMLARVTGAALVRSDIETLELTARFDAVLLASHLLNTPDRERRAAFLRTARRHLAVGGRVIAQWHPPEWFDTVTPGPGRTVDLGPLTSRLDVLSYAGGLLTAVASYRAGEATWTHHFTAARLDDTALAAELARAGLGLDRFLDPGRHWLSAAAS